MAKYYAKFSRPVLSTVASVGELRANTASPTRLKIYELNFGINTNPPANNVYSWQLQRITTAGTSTAITPQARDPADAASNAVAGANETIEPTYTANAIQYYQDLNQQMSWKWTAKDGDEIVVPAITLNGLGILTPTAPVGNSGNMTISYNQE